MEPGLPGAARASQPGSHPTQPDGQAQAQVKQPGSHLAQLYGREGERERERQRQRERQRERQRKRQRKRKIERELEIVYLTEFLSCLLDYFFIIVSK